MPDVRQLPDDRQHLRHQHRVERRRDLVEQQDVRLHRQRAHDGDPLLLAAREPVGHRVALVGQPEARAAAPSPRASAPAPAAP